MLRPYRLDSFYFHFLVLRVSDTFNLSCIPDYQLSLPIYYLKVDLLSKVKYGKRQCNGLYYSP